MRSQTVSDQFLLCSENIVVFSQIIADIFVLHEFTYTLGIATIQNDIFNNWDKYSLIIIKHFQNAQYKIKMAN